MTYVSEVLSDSPVGFWLLDEASGNWSDSSGNGHNASVSEPGTAATYGVTGPLAGHTAVKFNGGTYARVTSASELHVSASGAPWSLEAWVKGDTSQSTFGSPSLLCIEYTGTYVDYLLGFWTGSGTDNQASVNYYRGSWENLHDFGFGLDDNTWHHIVGTFDGTDFRLYIDKNLRQGPSTPGANFGSATSNDLLIGCRWDSTSTRLTNMAVAGLAVYPTALSSTRIAAHYDNASNAGTNNPQSVDVGATGTVALATQKTKSQAIAVSSAFTAALSRALSKGQSIAVGATLTASLTKIKTLTKAIAVASTVTAALSEVAAVAAHVALDNVLPSFKQRLRLAGSGTGFVPPDFTIDLHSPIIGATFAGLRASWTADGPGAMEVDLRPTDINDSWTPGAHQIVLNWGGGPVFAGTLERLEQSGPPEDVRFTASALGLAARLDYRIVRHEFEIRDHVDVMVSELLTEAQTQFNGDMGFTMGTVSGTTANRLRNYCFGVNIGDAIRELAQVGNGFDWEVDANAALNIWQNTRGVHTGKTVQDSDTNSWAVTADTGDTLTNVSSIGSQEQPFGPIHRLSYSPGLSNVYGRREVAIDVDSTDEMELFDSGDAELSTRAGARMQVQTMWIDDRGPWQFGEVWLQDIVSVVLPTYFGGTQDMRCTEISLSLEPGTHYFVEHTFEALCVDITQAQDDGA